MLLLRQGKRCFDVVVILVMFDDEVFIGVTCFCESFVACCCCFTLIFGSALFCLILSCLVTHVSLHELSLRNESHNQLLFTFDYGHDILTVKNKYNGEIKGKEADYSWRNKRKTIQYVAQILRLSRKEVLELK